MGANYQYSHSIDDAGLGRQQVRRWCAELENIAAEEGNCESGCAAQGERNVCVRAAIRPGQGWFTTGTASQILEGFSISGSFTFATGTPLSPSMQPQCERGVRHCAERCGPTRTRRVGDRRGRLAEAVVQSRGLCRAAPPVNLPVRGLWQCATQFRSQGRERCRTTWRSRRRWSLGDTRSMEIRATINNAFNTVQYSSVDTNVASPTFRAGHFGWLDAVVSIHGEVQILSLLQSALMQRLG